MGRVGDVGVLSGAVRAAIGRGGMVVTANERAARMLRQEYDERRRAEGSERWEPAEVLSWSSWTRMLWRRLLVEGRVRAPLLNPAQEHAVWRRVLAADTELSGLRGIDGLAEMAAEAWGRLCAYTAVDGSARGRGRRVALRLDDGNGGTDIAAFARWAVRFAERCEEERLLPGGSSREYWRRRCGRGSCRRRRGSCCWWGSTS